MKTKQDEQTGAGLAGPPGYAALVNALREAVLRLEEWGPGPADAFWINEVAKPLITKYSKPHNSDSANPVADPK